MAQHPDRPVYTPKQGRYLAFIDLYIKLNGRSPAEADFEAYFKTSPAAVHQMIVALGNKGWIERRPGEARTIRLRIPPEQVPDLATGQLPLASGGSLWSAFPTITEWLEEHQGYIEIGYDPNTDTFARAIDEGGMVWSGGGRHLTLDEALQRLESGLAETARGWR